MCMTSLILTPTLRSTDHTNEGSGVLRGWELSIVFLGGRYWSQDSNLGEAKSKVWYPDRGQAPRMGLTNRSLGKGWDNILPRRPGGPQRSSRMDWGLKISGYRAKASYMTEGYRQGARQKGAVWHVAKWGLPACLKGQLLLISADHSYGRPVLGSLVFSIGAGNQRMRWGLLLFKWWQLIKNTIMYVCH